LDASDYAHRSGRDVEVRSAYFQAKIFRPFFDWLHHNSDRKADERKSSL